jgi:hypothetical protein
MVIFKLETTMIEDLTNHTNHPFNQKKNDLPANSAFSKTKSSK